MIIAILSIILTFFAANIWFWMELEIGRILILIGLGGMFIAWGLYERK